MWARCCAPSRRETLPGRARSIPPIDPALEAVCLKAMALNPEDRYPTPRALAEDIERWTADEPVTAWREPLARRARRWARRNRTAVTAAAVAVLVALAGMTSVLAVQARANAGLKLSNDALVDANARVRTRQRRPAGGQRARAGAVQPGDGRGRAVPRRGQRGPAPEGEAVRGAADQAAARGGRLLRQARASARGTDRPRVACGVGQSLRRAGRVDRQDRLEARGAGRAPQGAGRAPGAGRARRWRTQQPRPMSRGACSRSAGSSSGPETCPVRWRRTKRRGGWPRVCWRT